MFNFLSFYGKTGESLQSSGDLTKLANFTLGATNSIVALAGGGQAGSPVLAYAANEIDTVVTTNDSVQLPPAIPGARVLVLNAGANTVRIYAGAAPNVSNGSALDQIVPHATNTANANGTPSTVASGYTLMFACTTPGVWKQLAAAS